MTENNVLRCCFTCKESYEDFGQLRSICKPCRRKYDREYHTKRSVKAKQEKVIKQLARARFKRKYIFNYLSNNPCVVCSEDDPVVLEFDHIDPTSKRFNVSDMTCHSIKKIDKEIALCRVLCANCHRRHTATQLGWYSDIVK